MTATYDGRFLVSKDGIQACCRSLDRAVFAGIVYKGSAAKRTVVALRMPDSKTGLAIRFCPFCGASLKEGSE